MSKKMLMVATVPSMIGQFNMSNINILLDMGYQIDIACDFKDTSVWPINRINQFKKNLIDMNINCIHIEFSRNPVNIDKHISSYKCLRNLINKRSYTFIHTHTPIASAIVRIASKKSNTRVIYTAHGFHFFKGSPVKNWMIYYPVERWLSRYTDVLITINREDYYLAKNQFKAKKTVYIPGVGINTDEIMNCRVDKTEKRKELGIREKDFILLSVGELSERKNQKLVIDALGQMKKDGNLGNIIYVIVGQGNMKEELINLVNKYEIENHVKFIGFRSDIIELCKTVDCFVHPSIREGLGIAPLEAMAAGLPLISTSVNGMKDYVKNEISGCCVNPYNVREMINAIKKMASDSNFRIKCSHNNIITAKKFDIKNTEDIMTNIYDNYK